MGFFQKIREATEVALDSYILKAKNSLQKKEEYVIDRKAFTSDDMNESFMSGYKERPSSITFEVLRNMAMRDSIVASIIQTMVSYVKQFSQPQPNKYSTGFKIVLRDSEAKPTEKDKNIIRELEDWLLTTGYIENRESNTQINFGDFLQLITRDILTYDQTAIETIRSKEGGMSYFIPTDASSIRFATKKQNPDTIRVQDNYNINPYTAGTNEEEKIEEAIAKDNKRAQKGDEYKYVQIYEGRVVRGFYEDELILKMMNPVTLIQAGGYSIGPLEYAANIVSYHLYTEAHNKLFFVQGFAQRGLLHIEGDIPEFQLDAFRRQWREQVSSTTNAWRTPILAGAETKVNWIDLGATNKEMEFSEWMHYLIKILCALFGLSPQEINFDISRSGGGSPLGDSGERFNAIFKNSIERGLKPLLEFIEDIINECILKYFNNNDAIWKKYKFTFCGIDAESKEEELERHEKEIQNYKTINEVRAELDLDSIDGGDIILNPNFMQWYAQFSGDAKEKDQQMFDQQQEQNQNFSDEQENNSEEQPQDEHLEEALQNDQFTKSLRRKSSKPKLIKVEVWRK